MNKADMREDYKCENYGYLQELSPEIIESVKGEWQGISNCPMNKEVMSAYKRVLKFIAEKQAGYSKCLSKNMDEGHKRAIQIEYASMISGLAGVALAIEDWVGMQYIAVSDEWYDPKLDED